MTLGELHLFGEMDLNLDLEPKEVYKKACHISEACGYVTSIKEGSTKDKGSIEINGEDCHDNFTVVNVLYYEGNKINKVQKLVYRNSENKLIQVFEYLENNFKEIWRVKEELKA